MKNENYEQEVQRTLRELGIKNVDWKRGVSASDVLYLLDQCPFLQIMNTAPNLATDLKPLKLIQARSGWKIHDYGNAMSSSPGELLFGGAPLRKPGETDEGGEGGRVGGVGTIVNQAVITAFQMIELAKEHGWTGVLLVDAHPLMAWAAWVQAEDSELSMEGFTPTAKDLSKRRRFKLSAEQLPYHRPSFS